MSGQRVLLVDDDDFLRQAVREHLQSEGFVVSEASDGAGALAAAATGVDAAILDTGLPDADGCDVCRDMRRQGITIPIILLAEAGSTAAAEPDCGATDVVAKPFRPNVLLARLRTHLHQHEHSEAAAFRIGPYSFQPAARLIVDGQNRKIRLTDKEAAILKVLCRAKRVIARDMLLHEVWGYGPGISTHTLETHVYRLRQKIEDDPANARLLITESGGYRLVV